MPHAIAATFGDDVAFLKSHTEVVLLTDESGAAQVAVSPAWQGRVLTSTASGDAGRSFGWINRELIESGKKLPHMNGFGGEDRFWLGPEGGQFSIYFAKGVPFDFEHWFVPEVIDTKPFKLVEHSRDHATFTAKFHLENYSGTNFSVAVKREVKLLKAEEAWRDLGVPAAEGVKLVGFESVNQISNAGNESWNKETGLLSIWILGMFTPAPRATVAVPIEAGAESELGRKVTSDYFGEVPSDRLKVADNAIFLKADGKYRSKIGVSPRRSLGKLAAYDADNHVLTIVQVTQPAGVTEYVNSLWKLQDNPYGGDAINSYNDGPPAPGEKPMGPFFEMESSSPAVALAPEASITHTHRTIHLTGSEADLDRVAKAVVGLSLQQIEHAF